MTTPLVPLSRNTHRRGRPGISVHETLRRKRRLSVLPVHQLHDEPIGPSSLPFAITSFGELGPFSAAAFPHRHDFYELLFVTGGTGRQVVDSAPYRVEPGSIYLVAPGQVQYWEQAVALEGRLILFKEEFLPEFYRHRSAGEVLASHRGIECRPDPEDFGRIGRLVAAIDREYHRSPGIDRSVLQSYLHIVLVELRRLSPSETEETLDRSSELAREFLALVRERIPDEQTVAGYASEIGVTPKHLAEVVRQVTGSSPAEIIRGALTVEAKRMLAHTELTIAQIADALAFDNPSYFGRFFKRESGMRPGEYRAESMACR